MIVPEREFLESHEFPERRVVGLLLGRCPSTVRLVFPVLVFQLSKQQNRTRTTSSTVLKTSPNRTRTKKVPLEEL